MALDPARVRLLTPAHYAKPWEPELARLAQALAGEGLAVEHLPWPAADPARLDGAVLTLPLLAWGYARVYEEWLAMLAAWEAAGVPMLNPVPLLRWNSDKSYLVELEASGVPVPPTIACPKLDEAALAAAREALGGGALVVKPPVSAGAAGTHRLAPGDPVPDESLGTAVLIQPYLPAIESEGEYALFYFGGALGHAIVKRPRAGDFRVQPQFGGSEARIAPSDEALALAERALAALPGGMRPLYARVDMARAPDGTLRLMELEMIEPSLFLEQAGDGGAVFARAVKAAISAGA